LGPEAQINRANRRAFEAQFGDAVIRFKSGWTAALEKCDATRRAEIVADFAALAAFAPDY